MSNPERGCGKKKRDAFYLEGGLPSKSGNVWAWTWCLGDGIDDIAPLAFPARQITYINPPACLATQSIVKADDHYIPAEWDEELYVKLCESMKAIGVGDHVGSKFYSAASFARETNEFGLSRRVTKKMALAYAAIIQQFGSFPSLLTHSRVPVFRSVAERQQALDIALNIWPEFDSEHLHFDATWRVENWGMYSSKRKRQYNGKHSFMVPVLNAVSGLDRDWNLHQHNPLWQEAREFYKELMYQEQTIGLAWVLRVTYTLPKDQQVDKSLFDVPGLRFLDLSKEEVQDG